MTAAECRNIAANFRIDSALNHIVEQSLKGYTSTELRVAPDVIEKLKGLGYKVSELRLAYGLITYIIDWSE